MTVSLARLDHRRFRLAGNDNETVVVDNDDIDVEGHRLASNDNDTVIVDDDDIDVEGHRLAANDNETIVEGAVPVTEESVDVESAAAEAPRP